jgi:hypothetical protein
VFGSRLSAAHQTGLGDSRVLRASLRCDAMRPSRRASAGLGGQRDGGGGKPQGASGERKRWGLEPLSFHTRAQEATTHTCIRRPTWRCTLRVDTRVRNARCVALEGARVKSPSRAPGRGSDPSGKRSDRIVLWRPWRTAIRDLHPRRSARHSRRPRAHLAGTPRRGATHEVAHRPVRFTAVSEPSKRASAAFSVVVASDEF